MTDSRVPFGRKAVILAVFVSLAAMFATSFIYRMENPNLFVRAQASRSFADAGEGEGGPAMGGAMNGAMSRVKEYMDRVKQNPDDLDALVGLGNSFLMMRAWDRALEPLEKARQLKPDDVTVLKAVGIAYFNKQEYPKAVEAYETILKVDPEDTLALFNLGVIYKHNLQKPDVAQTYFEKVLALEKQDAEMIKLARQELAN
ncbi:Tetratricopeptide TPR_1 repeat-containing protein [Pseudodesulfovibrio mercurii]|uniref:Tetratricopeptide TPR_1 repeat-containing protein n=1 Tax=Pseudodesulfovibrio mercurii TaxID=641491 RepID=F0JKR3_9BACT|nr:tetratricopeptide repeat protein [Pseudodesulfovibrio mercurii]EGB16512.1 Tetratricopeptide TPR_1 repeat-containing protein [Pseudodesulfovibrio mercurii]